MCHSKSEIVYFYLISISISIISTRLTKEQKSAVLKWKSESATFIQREFRKRFQSKPASYPAIISLVKMFDVTGTVTAQSCLATRQQQLFPLIQQQDGAESLLSAGRLVRQI